MARVLVVEPDPTLRAARMNALRAAGHFAAAAEDATSAWATIALEPPDACLVAETVPGAIDLVRQLRSDPRTARTALVMVAASPTVSMAALKAGADELLLDPADARDAAHRARVALDRRVASEPPREQARRDIAVLFADIRGFTRFTEGHDPETVVLALNELFDGLVDDVFRYGGEVDKFIGDAVLALFGAQGAPQSGSNELSAVRAALDMLKSVRRFNRENLLVADVPLAMGIGIASGEAVVGMVGSRLRRERTAIGGAVNLASRLQGVAAEGEIVLSDRAYKSVQSVIPACMAQDVAIKGRGVERVYILPAVSLP